MSDGRLRVAVAAAITFSMLTGIASAQSSTPDEEALQDVVITGSRIRGIEPTGSTVIGVNREDIVKAGTTTTNDLLRKVPQIIGIGASETASAAQNGAANATRASAVNLRGIGSNATLLLFDGRRLPPSGAQGQVTDASVIPSIALERIEVVADGGSAIYGSDAVTGVVNLIPRNNFTGQESMVRMGFADGYRERQVGHIMGFGWETGHLMIAGEWADHTALDGFDRSFYTTDLRSRGGTDFRATTCSPGNIVVGGVSYAIPAGSSGVGLTPANFVAGTVRRCDNLPRGQILPESKRGNLLLSGTQDINDALSVFVQGFYSRRDIKSRASGNVANLTVTSFNPYYFNPTGGTGPVTVQYDLAADAGFANNPATAESWEGIIGGRYKLSESWQLETYISHGESADGQPRTQDLNNTASGINFFLNGIVNAQGVQTSAPPAYFNPFGSGSANNAGVIAAVNNGMFKIFGGTAMTEYAVQADGPLFSLPGGAVRVAAGASYRYEELNSLLRSGSTVAPVFVPGFYSRNVKAAFAELFVPLVGADNSLPGAQKLDLSISGRTERYSDFGNATNPKVGIVWQPVGAILFRGSWGKSFRAPSPAEIDPLSSGSGLYGDNLPCATPIPPLTQCFGIGIAGGNSTAQPEKATTWSAGIELTPEAIEGLRASVTYFNIDYENQILSLRGTAGLLTNPLYAGYRILNPTQAQIDALVQQGIYNGTTLLPNGGPVPVNTSLTAGTVLYIQDGRRQNLGTTIAKGVDVQLDYSLDTALGRFNVGATGEYFTDFTTQAAPGAVTTDVRNTLNFPQKLRARGELGWSRDAVSATAYVNFTSSYQQINLPTAPNRDIASYTSIDASLSYDLGSALSLQSLQGLSVQLAAQNLFDKEPPFVNLQTGGYDPQSVSPIGRLVSASLRLSW